MTSWAFENKGQRISELFVSEGINIFLIFVQKICYSEQVALVFCINYYSEQALLSLNIFSKVFSCYITFLLKEIQACNDF